jgi:hypothetical protein
MYNNRGFMKRVLNRGPELVKDKWGQLLRQLSRTFSNPNSTDVICQKMSAAFFHNALHCFTFNIECSSK